MKRQPDPCPACGTWVCDRCGWKRTEASRLAPQHCAKCLDPLLRGQGHWEPIHHWNPVKAQDHLETWEHWKDRTLDGAATTARRGVVRP